MSVQRITLQFTIQRPFADAERRGDPLAVLFILVQQLGNMARLDVLQRGCRRSAAC